MALAPNLLQASCFSSNGSFTAHVRGRSRDSPQKTEPKHHHQVPFAHAATFFPNLPGGGWVAHVTRRAFEIQASSWSAPTAKPRTSDLSPVSPLWRFPAESLTSDGACLSLSGWVCPSETRTGGHRSARCSAARAGMKSLIGGSIKLLSCGLPELSTHGRSRKKCAQPALVFFLAPRGWADQASLHSFIPAKYD